MPPVVILGCGPAGLFAAQAIKELGGEPIVHSDKKKSQIYGAQFLHQHIPGLNEQAPEDEVLITKIGKSENYAKRVYGDPSTPTSWEKLSQLTYPAWSLQKAYDNAWNQFEAGIVDIKLDAEAVEEMTAFFPLVISTIPLWSICKGNHQFKSVNILVAKQAVGSGLVENYIIYNGTEQNGWYRSSSIFGYESTETMADDNTHPIFKSGAEVGFKIVGNNCDCHPNLVRAGRLGKWERGVLTHHAFHTAVEAYAQL